MFTKIYILSCQDELDQIHEKNRNSDNEDSDDDEFWKDADQESPSDMNEYPDFSSFDLAIRNAMTSLGQKVFIKLNWSSPKDAKWALNKLSCDKLSDVYILLRSSDFINHDLNMPFEQCEDLSDETSAKILTENLKYFLVLREWISLNPSMEFRCFVANNQLIGIYYCYFKLA